MAKIIGGIGASHSPTIAYAKDTNKGNDAAWKPIFDDFSALQQWVHDQKINTLFLIFNDHITSFFFDHYSPFTLGVDDSYETADEGGGARDYPAALGHVALSQHIALSMMNAEFDLATFQKKPLDHGFFSPYSMIVPEINGTHWEGKVVPLQVGVLQFPAPTAKRCYQFGKALRKAIQSFPDDDMRVAIVATGGLSHQVHGERCGFNNEAWDNEFLDTLASNPEALTTLTHADYAAKGGFEGAEVIMWLIMRGALSDKINNVHRSTYLPSMTNIATVIYEDTDHVDAVIIDNDLTHQLDGLEKLEGTYPFTLERSHKAYRLNQFLRDLSTPSHREHLLTDQETLMTNYQLTEEEKEMIRELKWIDMIRYGAIFFGLEKLSAVLGKSNPEIYASMRGETMAQFQASRKVSMTYSVGKK
jgi:gallate dioxygenase